MNFVQAIQDYRDPASGEKPSSFPGAALARQQWVSLLKPCGQPALHTCVPRSHPCNVNITGTGTCDRSATGTCSRYLSAARTRSTAAPLLPDPGEPAITSRP